MFFLNRQKGESKNKRIHLKREYHLLFRKLLKGGLENYLENPKVYFCTVILIGDK